MKSKIHFPSMNMKILMLGFLMIMVMGFASAEIGSIDDPASLNQCIQIIQQDSQTNSATLTFVYYPDGTILNIQKSMTALGNGSFSYTFCNTSIAGEYTANGIGNYSNSDWNYKFYVNNLGRPIASTSQSLIYILLLIILSVASILSFRFASELPDKNISTPDGEIIKINYEKYLKWFLYSLVYIFGVWITYLCYGISNSILEIDTLTNMFYYIFKILLFGGMLALPILLVYGAIVYTRDMQIVKDLERGLSVHE